MDELYRIRVIVATHNRHKVREVSEILGEGFQCLNLGDLPAQISWEESGSTYEENACTKVDAVVRGISRLNLGISRAFIIGDDSGLEVDALGGAPGVHSARFAQVRGVATGKPADEENNTLLLKMLEGVPWEKRTARFVCVIAAVPIFWSGTGCVAAETVLFRGECCGRIGFEPRGSDGFGYDPLFIPDGFDVTFAEIGSVEKNKISHRARALAKFKDWVLGYSKAGS